MDKITAENEAKALVEKLGEGWDYRVCEWRSYNVIWWAVENVSLKIRIDSPLGKETYQCVCEHSSAYGDTPAKALYNLQLLLQEKAQQISNFRFKLEAR